MTMTSAISEEFAKRVAAVSDLPLEQRPKALEALYQELASALDASSSSPSSDEA